MEEVFVVNRQDFFAGEWPQGFHGLDEGSAPELLSALETRGRYAEREEAEVTPAWKQVIPYCALQHREQIFCVERLASQGEARLHGRLSVGIGGHINPQDGTSKGLIRRALSRELREELELPDEPLPEAQVVGLLNDESNPVGQVHFGLVHLVTIPDERSDLRDKLGIRENAKMRGGFRALVGCSGLWQDRARLESWSRLFLQTFFIERQGRITEAKTRSEGSESNRTDDAIGREDLHDG
ncbi:MAG: hypothetical protein ACYTG5_05480 [Planctomycetota bacterium]|jgi:predicted NUDIX family phosphoesterase